jgi:hypothetical protein
VGEVPVAEVTAEGASGIRYSRYESAGGGERGYDAVKRIENLALGQMLKYVGGGDCSEQASMLAEKVTIVALLDSVQACCPGESDLLGTHVYARCIVAVSQEQPDQMTLAAADIKDRPSARRRQEGPDISSVDKSGRFAIAPACVVGRICLVEAIAQ